VTACRIGTVRIGTLPPTRPDGDDGSGVGLAATTRSAVRSATLQGRSVDVMDVEHATAGSAPVDRRLRTAIAVLGVVALLAGIAALLLPHATIVAVVWVFGIYLVVAGATLLVRAVARGPSGTPSTWRRVGSVVLGVLVLVGGVFAILHPPVGIRWLTLATGFAWVLEGITLLYAPTAGNRALVVTGAVLSFLSGLILITLPALGAVFAVVAVSSTLIVSGIVQLVIAITWTERSAAATERSTS